MESETFPGWLPIQVAMHYSFPLAELDGAGQTVAIISLGGKLDLAEIENDLKTMRLARPNLTIQDVDTANITPQQDAFPTTETHLDIEVIATICPAAAIKVYRGPNNGTPGFAAAIQAAVNDDVSVISISWGLRETPGDENSELEKVLVQAREAGISVCAAAGDKSSSDQREGNFAVAAEDGRAHVEYPASSPNVLSCGGTQLMMDKGVYHEDVWNNCLLNTELKRKFAGASGGGVSDLFDIPAWQSDSGVSIPSANGDRPSGRVVPDVAALAAAADWEIVETNTTEISGGTSAVAPLYASLIVMANQKRASLGKSRLGFINEALYEIAKNSDAFVDVVEGNNRPTVNYPGYDAHTGFDACTGWGTPNADILINCLVELP